MNVLSTTVPLCLIQVIGVHICIAIGRDGLCCDPEVRSLTQESS